VGSPATLLVIGANPWLAHGFPNVREHLNEIKKDPARRLIVIDPRRSETAQIAMMHMFCGVAWLATNISPSSQKSPVFSCDSALNFMWEPRAARNAPEYGLPA
jgi:hypothetical protein